MGSYVAVIKKRFGFNLKRKQSGAATVLVILMIGVGLVAVSMGTLHTMRSTQERQLVAHAQVNAQAGAWAAVEVVRQYLGSLNAVQIAGLGANQTWTITGTTGLTQSVFITQVAPPVAPLIAFRVTAQVTATAVAAQSSSTIEVVYQVTPGQAPQNFTLNGVLDFYNDLSLAGGIDLNVPAGANFNVDGDFTSTSVGISGTGLNRISVTGNVVVGAAVSANELWGRNVTISGGASATKVRAFGDPDGPGSITSKAKGDTCCGAVIMSGGSGVKDIQANGSVDSGGNGDPALVINALRDVAITRGGTTHHEIVAGGSLSAVQGGTLDIAKAVGEITLNGVTTQSVTSTGKVTCTEDWMSYPLIRAGGAVTKCKYSDMLQNMSPAPAISLIPKVAEVKLVRPLVDAWSLRSAANYALEYDGTNLKVTVKNINGVTDGTYYVLKNESINSSREWLCTSLDANGRCATPVKPFCNGFSAQNSCFSVATNATTGRFQITVSGKSLPPGVLWVNGDFHIGNGTYYNTIIATGDISTGGAISTYALNYAAAYSAGGSTKNAICKNEFESSVKDSDFDGMYPLNYCDTAGVYTPNALGNIGLLAGGYDPATNTSAKTIYTGGLINLGASNKIYGTVVSGDILKTGGDTKVYGYISAAGLQMSTSSNTLNGSTVVDLTNLPTGYNPNQIPNMSGGGAGVTAQSTVLWTRYL